MHSLPEDGRIQLSSFPAGCASFYPRTLSCLMKELKEEAGIDVPHQDVEKVADLEFTFEGEKTLMHVHVFLVKAFTGTPTESEEMRPRWFSMEELPFSDMWPDDPMWLPVVLRGGKVRAAFHFRGHNDILSQRIEEVDAFA
ncbi:7,8-dihydro-8-oxoguanine triphosphatase-like isoform X2 [Portunus trituberculatus]|uniref:7,8-dihydro-8-oxoguanine triphosphatase-like isoform X2 n=1 Tax=Portunus trituberculatus TaxID=210409 RepID=UPI001E1CF6B1|nr:7,8-dihydro-8-oxoguanine triphosphatase-like isoform X2 [Portunus trituberculatus]